jgi:hypothetical protein
MAYKKKLIILLSIIGALALIYVLGLIFEPERRGSRSAAYTWLDPKLSAQIDRIKISNAGETSELVRKNNQWFAAVNGKEYPAKQLRIEDFQSVFTRRAPYPVRASNASAHERLGLTEGSASRITLSGGAGLPLLDLLIGQGDQTGREIYLRRQGHNEVRSGEDKFSVYISGPQSSWYNLRLFPECVDGSLDIDSVQRLSVYAYTDTGGGEPMTLTRNGREWTFGGITLNDPDMEKANTYVRGILNIEADDFNDSDDPGDPVFYNSRIVLELGDRSIKTIRIGPADESNRRSAMVSGSSYVYVLSQWAAERLFREASYFEKQ